MFSIYNTASFGILRLRQKGPWGKRLENGTYFDAIESALSSFFLWRQVS